MLEVLGVSKQFGSVRAVSDLTFSAQPAHVFGLLGPNGAGKTTTIRMILDIIEPDSGQVKWNGERVDAEIRRTFGYLPEERGLYPKMKIQDQLVFFAVLHGMDGQTARTRIAELAAQFNLSDWLNKTPNDLSKGNQQKVQFMAAVAHRPPLLVLDEPFSGLDPINVEIFKDNIRELCRAGTTVVLSSHRMEQVEELCSDICIIDRSRAVVQGNLAELKRNWPDRFIRFTKVPDLSFLAQFPDARVLPSDDDYVHISAPPHVPPSAILHAAASAGPIDHFEVVEPSLNDIYLHYVKPEYALA
jgi:ABC-2 type transport system ATP-binding protein